MVFSSTVFLWLFLPVVIVLYSLVKSAFRNYLLLIASLIFYAWGEPYYVVLLLCSVMLNYLCGLGVGLVDRKHIKKLVLAVCVITNLLLLGYFKYFDFFAQSINSLSGDVLIAVRNIALPIGISFIHFKRFGGVSCVDQLVEIHLTLR